VIQFKLEADIIKRHPEFQMDDRLLLDCIDYENQQIEIDGQLYDLEDGYFPTIDPENPYQLNDEESEVIQHLKRLILHNEMFQNHARYLMEKGSMYLIYNHNLLFHAAIPLELDGQFAKFKINRHVYEGKALMDRFDKLIRKVYYNRYESNLKDRDYFLYLWQGAKSPLFAKSSMRTFERYFIKDKTLHKEKMNPYFSLRTTQDVLNRIYEAFDLNHKHSKIINGHVPLDVTKGDEVVLAGKRIYSIDGGMSKQYSEKTNIGGYSLISDSYAYFLVSHDRFDSYKKLIESEKDIIAVTRSEEMNQRRTYIYDTNKGEVLKSRIDDLMELLNAYRLGQTFDHSE
jgi:fructose-1,6-bisphosphatase-3